MFYFEEEARRKGYRLIGGIDEAGRGPLAGPVVACCLIMPLKTQIDGIRDSKKLSPKKRGSLSSKIKEIALDFSFGVVSEGVIDKINILRATLLAMQKAAEGLSHAPHFLLIDGNQAPAVDIPLRAIIKGDALSYSIACASILAKVERDRMMVAYDEQFPVYGFARHKGYPTRQHIKALKKYGPCRIHRTSFGPVRKEVDSR
ncbi:ribonuclease HII [bacterium]|nr:ribonuclease HII [bacterium]